MYCIVHVHVRRTRYVVTCPFDNFAEGEQIPAGAKFWRFFIYFFIYNFKSDRASIY